MSQSDSAKILSQMRKPIVAKIMILLNALEAFQISQKDQINKVIVILFWIKCLLYYGNLYKFIKAFHFFTRVNFVTASRNIDKLCVNNPCLTLRNAILICKKGLKNIMIYQKKSIFDYESNLYSLPKTGTEHKFWIRRLIP